MSKEKKLTRVEIINYYDDKGRDYVFWEDDAEIELSYQDEGRTLKIFIEKKQDDQRS
jgi:hypothetical protein